MNVRSEKGVTILALGITIVVMAILATITITASIGDNGLIVKTKEGTITASISEIEEAINSYILLKEKDLLNSGDFNEVTMSTLVSDGILVLESSTTTYKIYKITANGLNTLGVKGDYGKGTTNNIFKLKVLLDTTGKETKNLEVSYLAADGTVYN